MERFDAVATPDLSQEEFEAELIRDIAKYQHDPLGYVLYAFPWGEGELTGYQGPEKWQRDLLEDVGQMLRSGSKDFDGVMKYVAEAIQVAVASGHGIGKSALVAWLVLWAMSTMEDTRGVVTANTDTQLRTKTWPEVSKWHRLAFNRHWFTLTATAIYSADPDHEKNWRVDIIPWSENNTEAFAGLHNKGKRIIVIFDEASAIPEKISEVTEGALTDAETEILWFKFGNPTLNSGNFYDCFHKMRHRWKRYQIDSRTVSMTNKVKIAQWESDKGEDSDWFRVRVRGVFPNASAGQFIDAALVEAARGRSLRVEQFSAQPKIIGVDPKYDGNDEFCIYLRQGLMVKKLAIVEKDTTNDELMAGLIARYEDENKADAVFIDYGYGTGIFSFGQVLKRKRWRLVKFGQASPEDGYLNMRSYMWGCMRKWLSDGGAIPDDEQLCEELKAPHAYLTKGKNEGQIVLESKQDMKDRGVPSPNRADAIALTFAYPVQSEASRSVAGTLQRRREFANGSQSYQLFNRRK